MPKTIDDLREHLFATLDVLKDREKPVDVERVKAVVDVSGQLIDAAKVEVAFLNAVGGKGSGFIPAEALTPPASPPGRTRPAALPGR